MSDAENKSDSGREIVKIDWAVVGRKDDTDLHERDHLPPIREASVEVEKLTMEQIEVKEYVGGLVKSFERKVA